MNYPTPPAIDPVDWADLTDDERAMFMANPPWLLPDMVKLYADQNRGIVPTES